MIQRNFPAPAELDLKTFAPQPFQELVPKDDKEREIIIEETLAKNMIDWSERAGQG